MRISPIHIITGIMALLPLFSCHKEVSVETSTGLAGDFVATIDGSEWIAADSTRGATILAGLINITGVSVDDKQLSITLDDTVVGVYTLNQNSGSLATYAAIDSSDLYAFASNQGSDTAQAGGLVTVTEIDPVNKTISGTFSFKVYRDIDKQQKVITQGVFYKLSYSTSLPASNSTDTLETLIDGAAWSARSIIASAIATQLGITGSDLNGNRAVSLIIPLYVAPGSYTLDYTGNTYIALYNPVPTIALAATNGTLQIIENDSTTKRVRGNFQFEATDPLGLGNTPHNLTGGYFSVQYK